MRIMVVNWRDLRNPDAGGAEVHVHEIMTRMAARGHEVTVVSSNFPAGKEVEGYDGLRVIRRGKWYNANYVIPPLVRRMVREEEFDLVVEDINKIPFFLPALVDVPVLAVVPHLFGTSVFRETNFLLAAYVYAWEKLIPFVYQSCNFVAISQSTKEDLIARGIPKTKIDVVLCGLDHGTFRLLDGVARFDEPTVFHFGRIRKYKSIDVVIKALSLLRDRIPCARLLVAGAGPDRERLEGLCRRLGLAGAVKFLGEVPTGDLVELLNKSHVFLNASAKEGWGLTVLEANACGLPVVASDRPGLRDSVHDGETGFLVPYGDVGAFAERAHLLLTDRELWGRMSASASAWARSLTWERTADEMEAIFLREVKER